MVAISDPGRQQHTVITDLLRPPNDARRTTSYHNYNRPTGRNRPQAIHPNTRTKRNRHIQRWTDTHARQLSLTHSTVSRAVLTLGRPLLYPSITIQCGPIPTVPSFSPSSSTPVVNPGGRTNPMHQLSRPAHAFAVRNMRGRIPVRSSTPRAHARGCAHGWGRRPPQPTTACSSLAPPRLAKKPSIF